MALSVSTNTAAHRASANLSLNQSRLRRSFDRISSGKSLTSPVHDPGSLAVSMKLQAAINRISGAQNNVKNALSFLEVQDGFLESVGNIVDRMSELKDLAYQDPMKSEQDRASYNNEFKDLQAQLFDISQMKFNGVSLFADTTTEKGSENAVIGGMDQLSTLDNTLTIYTSAEGATGSKVSVHKSILLSALTFDTHITGSTRTSYSHISNENSNTLKNVGTEEGLFKATFAVSSEYGPSSFLDLDDISVGVITQALENISFIRAQNGGTQSRLTFNSDSLLSQKTNMRASLGRMIDADIAEGTTNLTKYSFLSQATASVLSPANSNAEIAPMFLC